MNKIMIIEDETTICNELKELLEKNNYEVILWKDYQNPIKEILIKKPDLILLDIKLPMINGETLLQNLRKKSNIPVIMVTSMNTEADEVLSMSYGADDYITKPYNPNILLLRIEAILKRTKPKEMILNYQDLKLDLRKGRIQKENEEIELTKNEIIIFSYLLQHLNQIVTRSELMTVLWDNDEYINENALTVNISRLRTKLKAFGYENIIDTRKKMGYILKEFF